jgi:hypothetical protein
MEEVSGRVEVEMEEVHSFNVDVFLIRNYMQWLC